MTLKIMIAGCAKDERDKIEASIKTAMGDRPARSDWNLSLVNIANQWSVEIDGPEPHFARVSLIATTSDLIEKLERICLPLTLWTKAAAPAILQCMFRSKSCELGERVERLEGELPENAER